MADVREGLAALPDESVHCVVTSPPYYGLRDYGLPPAVWGGDPGCDHCWADQHHSQRPGRDWDPQGAQPPGRDFSGAAGGNCIYCGAWSGQLGLEPTPQLFLDHLVEVFAEVRRVLRKDGTLWLNMGDTYSGARRGQEGDQGGLEGSRQNQSQARRAQQALVAGRRRDKHRVPRSDLVVTGLARKNLMGIPWRLALALQASGWVLRSEIIWHKTNPMPESITDRPTKAHEHVFLLAKSPRYFYDAEAIRERDKGGDHPRRILHQPEPSGGVLPPNRGLRTAAGRNGSGRNKRSVWTVATEPFAEAHYAVFPPSLVEPCIQAGTSEHGVCPECGAPWKRVVEREDGGHAPDAAERRIAASGGVLTGGTARSTLSGKTAMVRRTTTGWEPTCDHGGGDPVPATVLDPFSGAATTGVVCIKLGRRYLGIERGMQSIQIARRRLMNYDLDAATAAAKSARAATISGPLFEGIYDEG